MDNSKKVHNVHVEMWILSKRTRPDPAGIWRINDVVLTSVRRDYVALTSIRRHFGTKYPLKSPTRKSKIKASAI